MNRTLDLLRELDDIRPDIENFIKTTSNSINTEEVNAKNQLIKQL